MTQTRCWLLRGIYSSNQRGSREHNMYITTSLSFLISCFSQLITLRMMDTAQQLSHTSPRTLIALLLLWRSAHHPPIYRSSTGFSSGRTGHWPVRAPNPRRRRSDLDLRLQFHGNLVIPRGTFDNYEVEDSQWNNSYLFCTKDPPIYVSSSFSHQVAWTSTSKEY